MSDRDTGPDAAAQREQLKHLLFPPGSENEPLDIGEAHLAEDPGGWYRRGD